MDKKLYQDSLKYHQTPQPGKIETGLTKSCASQRELSMAYSPGVAAPCLEIEKDVSAAWEYTGKGNSVAVVSDGTAVLGLGNIGPHAALPVMEGKSVLFKRFADIDAVPVCFCNCFDENGRTDTQKLIDLTAALEPTFGGVNLEDIGAPACFQVEQVLKGAMNIPVFHDDQHGTAIISLAGVLNALKIVGKNIADIIVAVNGAGAAGIACSDMYIAAGVKREHIVMCDSRGVIYRGRDQGMTPEKERFAIDTDRRSLADALAGADVFLGLSVADCVTAAMVESMAGKPIIFAMANPVPEIYPQVALAAGAAVVGTGRTDFPNQVNNVLGFPGIFRGALDVRASDINESMKMAASLALVELACEKIPERVKSYLATAYADDAAAGMFEGENPLKSTYVIPKPFDPRVVPRVARRVAEAAVESGVSRIDIGDFDAYERFVCERIAAKHGAH